MDSKTFVYDKKPVADEVVAIPSNIRATLKVLSGNDEGTSHVLDRSQMTVGRGEGADIRVDDDAMSRRHLEIVYRNLEFRVRDLDSSNGTFLNGSEVKEYALRNGDKIMAGETLFAFHVQHVTG